MSIKCLDHRKCDISVKRLLGFLFYSLVAMYVQAQVSETKLLLSGKNHEAFLKQHFPGQPIFLVYILAILGGKVQDKA